MASGIVVGAQAFLPLKLVERNGNLQEIDFVIDTGFTEYLIMPSKIVRSLDLEWINRSLIRLAGEIRVPAEVYEAVVIWDGKRVTVSAYELEGDSLAGMSFLRGSELRIQVEDGGLVDVDPL